MDPRLAGELAANHGVVTRRRALELGLDERSFDATVRAGALVRIRRGVFTLPAVAAAATTRGERQRLTDRAAALRVPEPFVRSHSTAALELGMPVLLPPRPMTHVTQHRHGIRTRYGVKHHVAPYLPDQVVTVDGFSVLDPVRTALDIAREDGHPYGVVAVDGVRWLGHTVDDLVGVLEQQMRFWPHRSRCVQAIELSDPGAESLAETLARMLLVELGLTDVETQFGLTDGNVTHYADLRVGRHLVEVDGRSKYIPESSGGLAVRDVAAVVLDEKQREDWFRGFHLGMSRLTWSDVWGPGRAAAGRRLLREKAQTDRLWGSSIDDLERYRARDRRAAA
jgi:hypothetical protein